MNKPLRCAAVVAALSIVVGVTAPVFAQGGAHYGVAVIDLKEVFEQHKRFQQMRQQLMNDVQTAESTVKARQEELRALVEQLKALRPGTPEYKNLEADIANREADLKVDINIQKKDFMQREAKIHYHIYREVLQEISHFAQQRRLSAVLRINSEQPDVENPQSILQELNKPVVYYDAAIDITVPILQILNQRAGNPPAAQGQQPAQGVPNTAVRPGVPGRPQGPQ